MHFRVLSSIPGPYVIDVSSTLPTPSRCDNQQYFHSLPNILGSGRGLGSGGDDGGDAKSS